MCKNAHTHNKLFYEKYATANYVIMMDSCCARKKMLKHTRKGKAKIVEISMAKQKSKLERRSGNNDRMYG